MSDSKDKEKDKNKGGGGGGGGGGGSGKGNKNKDNKDDDKDKEKDENKDKDQKLKENEKDRERDREHERSGSGVSGVGVFSQLLVDAVGRKGRERGSSTFSDDFKIYKGSYVSLGSPEIITITLETGEINRHRQFAKDDQIGTQRVYKKTSPNSLLTLYLPTRELVSVGNQPAILKGILHADPKSVQGLRVYAQLTLTFRYGREDEEVMGLRFCNEAIMCLHQLWPQNEEIPRETLTPLQEALIKRLGEGAFPFTLSLTPQAPPSVQLVPAKRYYGAPIGTSYEVRCFIADRTDDKFHRRATVRMGVRVIHRTDVFSSQCGPENFASIINNQLSPPPPHDLMITKQQSEPIPSSISVETKQQTSTSNTIDISSCSSNNQIVPSTKSKKSERIDSFSKIRLSPKSFRFSSRFGRSKSEAEKCPNDPFYSYSKSFQEYDTCGGPQGSVDKPFLLQEGRVSLKASLDKAWYTHGEDVIVTINIKNDSRKTVRKIRVCAIQHVDVCMFNNGKFKNVVADSDITSPGERTVGPGSSLNATVILKPQRGPTKNWIALEDSLQRSCEPDEITGAIAASAVRTPTIQSLLTGGTCTGNVVGGGGGVSGGGNSGDRGDDRNVFAIYVSYYVKVKLTLSGMGGELSLKLPFALVHIDSSNKPNKDEPIESSSRLSLIDSNDNKPTTTKTTTTGSNKSTNISPSRTTTTAATGASTTSGNNVQSQSSSSNTKDTCITQTAHELDKIDKIESIEDDTQINKLNKTSTKRRLIRHETLAKDDDSSDDNDDIDGRQHEKQDIDDDDDDDDDDDGVQTVNLEQTPIHHNYHQQQQQQQQQHKRESSSDTNRDDDSIDDTMIKRNLKNSPSSSTTSTMNRQQTTCVQIHTTSS